MIPGHTSHVSPISTTSSDLRLAELWVHFRALTTTFATIRAFCEVTDAFLEVIGNLDTFAPGNFKLVCDGTLVQFAIGLVTTQQDADVNADSKEEKYQDTDDDEDVDGHACVLNVIQETLILIFSISHLIFRSQKFIGLIEFEEIGGLERGVLN